MMTQRPRMQRFAVLFALSTLMTGSSALAAEALSVTALTVVSTSASGELANAESASPVYSPDGTKVVFASKATNLAPGTTAGHWQIYLKDLTAGTVTLLSKSASGRIGNGDSQSPTFSPDGTRVAFESTASNLAGGKDNGVADVFEVDLASGKVTCVSRKSATVAGNGASTKPVYSPSGKAIAFVSAASNFIAHAGGTHTDIFLKDLSSGRVTLVSSNASGTPGDNDSKAPHFSPDGTRIAFVSEAHNFYKGPFGSVYSNDWTYFKLFIKNLQTNKISAAGKNVNQIFGFRGRERFDNALYSADGKSLFFDASIWESSGIGGVYATSLSFYKLDINSSKTSMVSHIRVDDYVRSSVYDPVALTKDGNQILMTSPIDWLDDPVYGQISIFKPKTNKFYRLDRAPSGTRYSISSTVADINKLGGAAVFVSNDEVATGSTATDANGARISQICQVTYTLQ